MDNFFIDFILNSDLYKPKTLKKIKRRSIKNCFLKLKLHKSPNKNEKTR